MSADLQREVRTVLESLLDKLTCLEKYEDYVEKLNIEAVKSQNSTNVVSRRQCQRSAVALGACDLCVQAVTLFRDGRHGLPSWTTFV